MDVISMECLKNYVLRFSILSLFLCTTFYPARALYAAGMEEKVNTAETESTLETTSKIAGPEFQIQSWLLALLDKYIDNLKKQSASLTAQDIKRGEQLIKEAKANQQWAVAATEYARILGKDPENRQGFIDLSLSLQKAKDKEDNENQWQYRESILYSALQAYRLSKNNIEQAEALLVLGNALDPENNYETPSYQEVYNHINRLVNLAQFRQSHPEVKDLMPFQFSKLLVNNQGTVPNVCFLFTQNLATQGVHYQDYIHITPAADASLKAVGRELCLSPVQYGNTYDVILKTGLPNAVGEKTPHETKLSFKIKDQASRLSFSSKAYILMRDETPLVPLTAVNVGSVNLKILRVNDRDLTQIGRSDFLSELWGNYQVENLENEIGELLFEGEFDLGGARNKTITKQIPFAEVVKTVSPGIYVIYAEEKGVVFGDKARATQWLIISDIGLTTFTEANGRITVQARSLKSADPLAEVELQLLAHNNSILGKIKTNKEGIASFDPNLTLGKGGNRPLLILAYGAKSDFSLIDLESPGFDLSDRGVMGRKFPGPLDAFLYSEQGVYRPQDLVHINALLRDDKSVAVSNLPLTFKILRPDGVEVARKVITGSTLGFYEFNLPLSLSSLTGQWTVNAFADLKKDPIGRLNFSVEDFVPSRILVQLKANKSYLNITDPVDIQVTANYLFGAKASGLKGSAVLWFKINPNPFPNYKGFTFGLKNEKFLDKRRQIPFAPLDAEGKGNIEVRLDPVPKSTEALEAVVQVTLNDTGGRPEIGYLKLPVHLQPMMIGIKSGFTDNMIPDTESSATFEVIALNTKGELIAENNLEYELFEERSYYTWYQPEKNQAWQYQLQTEDKFLTKGEIATKAQSAIPLTVDVKNWGQYRLEIRDPKSNAASSIRFSKGWSEVSVNTEIPDRLKIKVDKNQVTPGETISLLIQSPFEGQGILSIANDKILETRNIKVSPKGTTVKIKASEDFGTGVYCLVSAFRPLADKNEQSFLPKRAVGISWIGMNTNPFSLDVEMKTPATVRPNQTVEIPIRVRIKEQLDESPGKAPENAAVTVAAVDEGILKLTDFKTPDPKDYFLGQRQLGLVLKDYYGKLIEPLPGVLGQLRSGSDAALLSRNRQALSKRSFKIVSLYQGLVPLDKDGNGTLVLNLPDFNGTLRLMAVAFDSHRVGNQSQSLLVRDPVVVEGVLPRFLAPNDESQMSISLHNVSGPAGTYVVTVKGSGSIAVKGKDNFEVSLNAEQNSSLIVPIQAKTAGDGKILLQLQGKDLENKNVNLNHQFDLSVREATPYSQRTHSKKLKANETEHLSNAILDGFVPETVEAKLSFSSRLPWDPEAIYRDLKKYPYACTEQLLSRSIASLLHNSPEDQQLVNNALAILSENQNADGSFSLWYGTNAKGDPWLTAYVLDFLLRAEAKNIAIPKYSLERGLNWLVKYSQLNLESEDDLMNKSYALYVLSKADKIDLGSIRYFYDTYYDKMSNYLPRVMVASALSKQGDYERAKQAFNRALSALHNGTTITLAQYGSLIRENAATLTLLLEAIKDKQSLQLEQEIELLKQRLVAEFVPQAENEIHDNKENKENKKSFSKVSLSTQEEAWILLASNAWLANMPKSTFEVKLNDEKLSTDKGFLSVSVTNQLAQGLKIQNLNNEAIWQNLEVSGILNTNVPSSQGMTLQRQYFDLNGKPITLDKVKQGTEVVVVLNGEIKNDSLQYILIADLLAGGFEIENTRLDQGGGGIGQLSWLPQLSTALHIEPRDDRYVAFLQLVENQNSFKFAYLLRAVTPGKYIQPGVWAEDMYMPEFRTESASSRVEIEAL